MPFAVIIDQQVELAGPDVYAAQQSHASVRAADSARAAESSSEINRDLDNATLDKDRPQLKRRPKKP
jgi:hypothetical protein